MTKHKKHKKHRQPHLQGHGAKDLSNSIEMKVVVPLKTLLEPSPPTSPERLVSISRAILHPSHPHSTQPPPHSSEHKHHKKHKKKHKKHHSEDSQYLEASQPKVAPIRLPVQKFDPPQLPSTDKHTHHKHKHKHKRSRESFEDSISSESVSEFKRPKITGIHFEENAPKIEPEKRLVTPLQIQLPPELTQDSSKSKKKKKKHKHSKPTAVDDEDVAYPPSPVAPEPKKLSPVKISVPPAQSSPGKQMKLMRGLEMSTKTSKSTPKAAPVMEKRLRSTPQTKPMEMAKLTPPAPVLSKPRTPQVKLSDNALKFFLKNLHHLIQKRDPENVFSEPVTDDIAPNYSSIITHPMDLSTMAAKIETSSYPSINEFKTDFELMCNNAMTYNPPDSFYYGIAKHLLSTGLQIIAKETSLRPDILHGRLASAIDRDASASPLPPSITGPSLNLSSPYLCRIPLSALSGLPDENIDVSSLGEIKDQSHLTKVVVGVDNDVGRPVSEEEAEDILEQVQEASDAVKENLDAIRPNSNYCFVNRNEEGKTLLNILNPDSATVDYSKPLDLTDLSNRIRMGNNAATVLKTELPMMRATPVSYLMYGPFGSFAPAYDSAFASLAKIDSELLLSTYGNDIGVSYAHSLQQFVKGTGSFVSEMADAVLNGLTNHRHSKLVEKVKDITSKAIASTETSESSVDAKNQTPEKTLGTALPDTEPSNVESAKGDITNSKTSSEDTIDSRKEEDLVSKENEGMDTLTEETVFPTELEAKPDEQFPVDDTAFTTESSGSPDEIITGTSEASLSLPMGDMAPETSDPRPPLSLDDMATETSTPLDEMESNSSMSRESTPSSVSSDKSHASEEGLSTPRESRASSASASSQSSSVLGSEALNKDAVHSRLQHTSDLLSDLHEHQNIRLSLPPETGDSGQQLLPGPSQEELDTADQVRGELVALTREVCPKDVVSVPSLHKAMGIEEAMADPENIEQPMDVD